MILPSAVNLIAYASYVDIPRKLMYLTILKSGRLTQLGRGKEDISGPARYLCKKHEQMIKVARGLPINAGAGSIAQHSIEYLDNGCDRRYEHRMNGGFQSTDAFEGLLKGSALP